MKKVLLILALFLVSKSFLYTQQEGQGVIKGRIFNSKNNEPVPFANIVIWGTNIGAVSDFEGNFIFTGVEPGFVELRASAVGFETYITEEIQVTNAKPVFIDIPMKETSVDIEEVVVKASPFRKDEDAPVSLRRIGIKEIEKNPGGNRDISRVIQSFPGVSSSVSFRNDLIVRGGGASENAFYLDGVEIPTLNHFATQGASGGPVGIINVDFIREVNYYSSAFPASRGGALSSVFEFKQKDGSKENLNVKSTVGASDLALTLDGPLGDNTTFVASARRSYLQFLFDVLELPFLPTYNDFQFKTKTRFDPKNELTLIGIGAIDQFELNLNANETEEQRYILSYLPVNEQWNYTVGAVYKRYQENSFDTWVLSRSHLNNISYKFLGNDRDSIQTLDYNSDEIENKLRYEKNITTESGFEFNVGSGLEYADYYNATFNKVFIYGQPETFDYETNLGVFKWGVFGQTNKKFFQDQLTLSLGFRTDANNYSTSMSNMLNQFSPRFSASYNFTPAFSLNFNTGRYHQIPPYTTLGFKRNGVLVNKENNLKYIESDHIVSGIELLPNETSKFTVEGFFKYYRDYPFSLADSIAIASKGADFGTFGDEEVKSISEGRAYGMEVLYRNRDLFGANIVLSYTLVRSEFKDFDGEYVPSRWDNKHLFNITTTRSFKGNWDVGFKWRFVGGAPFTPFDVEKTSLISAWEARNQPYLDYDRFNEKRLDPFHQLDIRVDKGFYFSTWSLMVYLDVQNVYNFTTDDQDPLLPRTDENGNKIVWEDDPSRYEMKRLETETNGTVLPSVGIIVEF